MYKTVKKLHQVPITAAANKLATTYKEFINIDLPISMKNLKSYLLHSQYSKRNHYHFKITSKTKN